MGMTQDAQELILMDEVIHLKRRVAELEERINILLGTLTVAGTGRRVTAEFPPEQLRLSDLNEAGNFSIKSHDM